MSGEERLDQTDYESDSVSSRGLLPNHFLGRRAGDRTEMCWSPPGFDVK